MRSVANAYAIRHWSTDAVEPARRLDYWAAAISEGFVEMSVAGRPDGEFDASLQCVDWGAIGVNRARGTQQNVLRTRAAIDRSERNYYYLISTTDAAWTARQDGRDLRLEAGDLVLIDSRLCYEFRFTGWADTISLQLAPAWVDGWLPQAGAAVARRIEGRAGFGSALSAFVRQLTPELAARPPLPATVLADQLGALLALAAPAAAADAMPSPRALREKVLAAVRERYAEPGLTAADIAGQLGVTDRTLHRALLGSGTTFARYLMAVRTDAARRMLADRRFDRLTAAEIGRRVGLLDPSHFARACAAWLGATPGELRRSRQG